MGAGGDIKEENKKLKERIEKEMKPEIDRLIQENESKKEKKEELEKRNKKLQQQIDKLKENNIDLSPGYIQELMEENAKMKDKIFSLKKDLELEKQNNFNLFSELQKLKLVCCQYQLMLLNQNQKPLHNYFNNNMLNSWRAQIRNIISDNSFIKSMNINNCNNDFNYIFKNNTILNCNNINQNGNFSNNYQDRVSTIIFSFENKFKYPIAITPKSRLMEVFYLVLVQIADCNFSDISKLIFHYNGVDISSKFLNNDMVSCLNLSFPSPIIEVIRKKLF